MSKPAAPEPALSAPEPSPPAPSLAQAAAAVLHEADPVRKATLSRAVAAFWRRARRDADALAEPGLDTPLAEAPDIPSAFGQQAAAAPPGSTPPRRPLWPVGAASPPDEPGRPARPTLIDPRKTPKRNPRTVAGRAELIHAIAHIELNAIDLHWDMVARFSNTGLPLSYFDDWTQAADDEAKHFMLLSERLADYGMTYGDLPAHAGLWRAAQETADDLLGRLAVVPMVLEARGLDVTPGMMTLFDAAGDAATKAALEVIYDEEVSHVAYGAKWFNFLCGRENLDPREAFHRLVRRYFRGALKPPFNEIKRGEAGIPLDFYWPLVKTE